MRIKRSNFDEVIGILPHSALTTHAIYGPPKCCTIVRNEDGSVKHYATTLRDAIYNEKIDGSKHFTGRRDILLKNLTKKRKCHCGYVHDCPAGRVFVDFVREGGIVGSLDEFSAEDIAWAREESARIWAECEKDAILMQMLFS